MSFEIESPLSINEAAGDYDYAYDSRGRVTEVKKDGASTHTFSYDANGNRTGATGSSGAVTATYDSQDRMASYGGATYTYTAIGGSSGTWELVVDPKTNTVLHFLFRSGG